jgi:hypothetical protein
MKFVAGSLNGVYLSDIQDQGIGRMESVKIAVAYASSSPRILEDCWTKGIRITFWGRYDETVPVTLAILKKFLDRRSPNYVCKLVPDIFHSKVIWWQGYGAYIGSANLTESAWFGNIEAGVFFLEDEIIGTDLEDELVSFFEAVNSHSYPLTEEIYKELSKVDKIKTDFDKRKEGALEGWNRNREIPKKLPLTRYVKTQALERQKAEFLREWKSTLQTLRAIGDRVSDAAYRPSWVAADVPRGAQADQFLHAFYYGQVREGTRSMHWEYFERNKSNPEKALQEAMEWWRSLNEPPQNEDRTLYEWAPFLREKLSKDVLLSLSSPDFVSLCSKTHALKDHSLRVKYTTFGSPVPLPKMNSDERIRLLAEWLYQQRSSRGGVLDTLYYVLWGGPIEDTPNRIFEAALAPDWKISHLGISTIGEMVGWALPDYFPPRNGRTSKALTALGYEVTIHSE